MITRTCEVCGLRILPTDDDGRVSHEGSDYHRACLRWELLRRLKERQTTTNTP